MPTRSNIDSPVVVNSSVGPQSIASNTTVNGASTDFRTLRHGSRLMAITSVGTRTDGTYTFVVQDSADDSSFATLAAFSGTIGAISAANTDNEAAYEVTSARPFVRVSVTSTSVTTGAVVAGYLVAVPSNI